VVPFSGQCPEAAIRRITIMYLYVKSGEGCVWGWGRTVRRSKNKGRFAWRTAPVWPPPDRRLLPAAAPL